MQRSTELIIYYLICPFIFISYLLEPLTSDIRIYLGTEKLAELAGPFPQNLDMIWEVKPVFSRFIFYVLNYLDPFTGWFYQIWIKLIVSVITIIILWYFSKKISQYWNIRLVYPFLIGFLGFFAIGNFVALECEYFAALLGLLILSLILERSKILWVVAGFLIIPLILIKGITLLMVFQIIPIWILIEFGFNKLDKSLIISKFKYAILGFIISSICYLLSVKYWFPHSISDIFLSIGTAHVGFIVIDRLFNYFFEYSMGIIAFAPMIVIGVLILPFIILNLNKLQISNARLLLLCWIAPVLIVIIQSEFFYYQYFPMILSAIISVCYLIKTAKDPDFWFLFIIVSIILLFSTFVAGWSPGMGFKGYAHYNDIDNMASNLDAKFNISNQPSTLYLSADEAIYYFNSPSACRYVLPLPIQRDMPDYSMKKYPEYYDNMNCTLNYTGKYIVSDDTWFNLSVYTHSMIKDKLDTQYLQVYNGSLYNGSWDVYERKLNV